jgi:hypothetical protein
MTTVIAPLSLNPDMPHANRLTPGDYEGSATQPAPPSDHIPPGGVVYFRPPQLGAAPFHLFIIGVAPFEIAPICLLTISRGEQLTTMPTI